MPPALFGRLALALCLAVCALPAWADPPAWSGMWQVRERYHRPNDGDEDDYRVVYVTQPRMAAAQAANDANDANAVAIPVVARGLPFGLNRGTCDRALVAPGILAGKLAGMAGADRDCVVAVLDHLPDSRQIAWAGDAGEIFRVTAERSYVRAEQQCRDYSFSTLVGGQKRLISATACRKAAGQWDVLD